MSSTPFTIIDSTDEHLWDDFVAKHPQGNIFQSRYIYEVYRNTKNYYPSKVFAVNQATGEIGGLLIAVIVNEIGGIFSRFSAHSIIQGGPLVIPGFEKTLIPVLLNEHDRLSRKKALYGEIRNLHGVKENLDVLTNYTYEDHLNFLIRLDQSEEDLWRQLHRAKKNHINKAQKMNIKIKELDSQELIPVVYKLFQETYQNAKIPLADISLFESTFRFLFSKGMAKFFLAELNGKYIAGQLFLIFNEVIYAWYLGASHEFINYHPNELITWYTLKWGMSHGFKLFDFGGAGNPRAKYGPRDYKREFGGEEVNFGRHKNVYKPLEMKTTEVGFGLYQKLISINRRFQGDRA
jgi:serine/alanine adding enzyme